MTNKLSAELLQDYEPKFMELAAHLSEENIDFDGGPFGAVIVRNGEVIATGTNRVTASNDPTAHAEISAIRAACQKLNTFNLKDCVVYSSCEPCPMCLSAIYWAGIKKIFFGNTRKESEAIDFSDNLIYEEIGLNPIMRKIPGVHVGNNLTINAFIKWKNKTDKTHY